MAKRNKAVFRGVFERIDDQAHNRIRLVAKDAQRTRAVMGEIVLGHFERTLFRAREPQAPVTDAEMLFGEYLAAAADEPELASIGDKEFAHWEQFTRTRIYGPTVEAID